MRRTRLAATSALVAGLVAASGVAAVAQTTTDDATATVTATVNTSTLTAGTRLITSVPAVALATAGSTTVSGAVSAVVTEVSVPGPTDGDWVLTASMTNLTDPGALPGDTSDDLVIPNSALSLSNRTVAASTGLVTGVTAVAPTGSATLDSAAELFTVSGQQPAAFYTNVHTGAATMTLTPPDGTVSGSYTGTLTISLIE